jgi:hypothetical protein
MIVFFLSFRGALGKGFHMLIKRKLKAVGIAVLLTAGSITAVTATSGTASASLQCWYITVFVNGTSGGSGEPYQRAKGHTHISGKHYISGGFRDAGGRTFDYSADNDNGSRDKPDSYYGSIGPCQ